VVVLHTFAHVLRNVVSRCILHFFLLASAHFQKLSLKELSLNVRMEKFFFLIRIFYTQQLFIL